MFKLNSLRSVLGATLTDAVSLSFGSHMCISGCSLFVHIEVYEGLDFPVTLSPLLYCFFTGFSIFIVLFESIVVLILLFGFSLLLEFT
jgi:hypothetical protein